MSQSSLSDYYEAFHASRAKQGTVAIRARIDFIRAEVGTGHDVVELGCRDGSLLHNFLAGNRVTGCDIDRRAVAACADRYGIETRVANLNEELPLPDATFDVVVLSEVLEHLPYPDLTLAEIARILKPAGKLVGSVPNAVRLPNRIRFLFSGMVEPDPTHLHHYGSASLHRLLVRYFAAAKVQAVAGRIAFLSPGMLGNYLLFTATTPKRRAEPVTP